MRVFVIKLKNSAYQAEKSKENNTYSFDWKTPLRDRGRRIDRGVTAMIFIRKCFYCEGVELWLKKGMMDLKYSFFLALAENLILSRMTDCISFSSASALSEALMSLFSER